MASIIKRFLKVIVIFIAIQILLVVEDISKVQSADFLWDGMLDSADGFIEQGKQNANRGEISVEQEDGDPENVVKIQLPKSDDVKTIVGRIYMILMPLGVAITVIVGGILGIKFMIASAEDKAKIKELLVPYVIGCIVIYGALGIWKITIEVMDSVTSLSTHETQDDDI